MPFDRPFDRLTVLSKVEGLTVPRSDTTAPYRAIWCKHLPVQGGGGTIKGNGAEPVPVKGGMMPRW